MNIIAMSAREQFGIFEALRDENVLGERVGTLAAYAGGYREKSAPRPAGLSDSVTISEAAMLLASGLLTANAPSSVEGQTGENDDQNATGFYGKAEYSAFARARVAAMRARNEASSAEVALLAPPPPGRSDPKGSSPALAGAGVPSDAAFAVARLQNRLRELQLELSTLENNSMPEQSKAVEVHNLTSQITQTMQDISGLLYRTQG